MFSVTYSVFTVAPSYIKVLALLLFFFKKKKVFDPVFVVIIRKRQKAESLAEYHCSLFSKRARSSPGQASEGRPAPPLASTLHLL